MVKLLLLTALTAQGEVTQSPASGVAPGGVVAPAVLPAGTLGLSLTVGAPEVGVGYRQGFAPLELEIRGAFDEFEVSFLGDVGVRITAWRSGGLHLGVGGGVGLKANTGATYFHTSNFAFLALRPRVAGWLTYAASGLVTLVSQVEIPLAVALTVGATQFTPTVGGGVELAFGPTFSLLVMGTVGADVLTGPSGSVARPVWGIKLGVGYRLF